MALLTATDVRHYFGGLCALAGFNLALEEGELMGLIGPNGAGKTTVFNLITGVYRASSGSIRFKDTELVGKTPHQITALRIGRTFQNIRLFRDLSVLDNVRIAHYARARYTPIEALLHLGRYRGEERRIVDDSRRLLSIFKLERLAGETAKNLPYGMQRKLEIARALAANPKVLLLDEPAAGLNPSEVQEFIALVGALRERFGFAVLVIEHRMEVIMTLCARIYVLNFGKLLACGTPAEIRENREVAEAYIGREDATCSA